MPNTQDLTGKIALVTGGSRNIGRETALALAAHGSDVVITYKTKADLAASTVAEIEAMGRRGSAIGVDLTGTAGLDKFVADLDKILGGWGTAGIDILVNNAGVAQFATFDQVTEDDLDNNFDTNYKSVFFLTQRLADRINDGGRIINIGSATARVVFAPLTAYAPIKAAVQHLTIYLADFFGKRGITVNVVAPGGLDNDMNAKFFDDVPTARDWIRSNTALGRIGMPADIGGVIAFLATDVASFISGAVIPVHGGFRL